MITLKKAESSEQLRSTRGMWRPIEVTVADGVRRSAMMSCPGCDEFYSLDRWTIEPSGVVTPSVNHGWEIRKTDGTVIPSCTFHDMVKLEGWTP